MATEAEVIVFFTERRIKLRRILLDQEPEMFAAVADMAAAAVVVGDGAVQKFLVFNLIRKGRQSLLVAHLDRFVMARCAETRRILLQQERNA